MPVAVGGLAIVTGSVPITFLALSALAVLAQTALVVHVARRVALDSGGSAKESVRAAETVGVLFACALLTVRTSGQLILDPFCSVLALSCVAMSISWQPGGRSRLAIGLFAAQVLGLFTKVSYLPLLAVPAVVSLTRGLGPRAAIKASVQFGLLPLVPVVAYLLAIPGSSAAGRDFDHLLNAWSLSPEELKHFATEMTLLFQFWPILIVVSLRRGGAAMRATLISACIVLLSTWIFRLPAIPRLYLPVLALMASGSSPAFLAIKRRRAVFAVLLIVALANYVLMILGTF